MKLLILISLLLFTNDPAEIAKSNKLKRQAEKAFQEANYEEAIINYSFLIDSMNVKEDELLLNRAHSFYILGDTSKAKVDYQNATVSSSKTLRSLAHQQLGVMAKDQNQLEKSLMHLKSALKNDPTNEGARYDYEVVKRLAKEQKEQQQDQENKDQQDQENEEKNEQQEDQQNKEDKDEKSEEDQQNQEEQEGEQDQEQEGEQEQQDKKEGEEEKEGEEQQKQEGEESDEEGKENKEAPQPSTQQKLEEMNISEEKAQMILEAMQNNEIQYIQQQRRKPTKAKDTGKPDW